MPKLNVLFVGASFVNFGGAEGPWDHSKRLQAILGHRLNVVGIVDPNVERSKMRLDAKRAANLSGWDRCGLYANMKEAGERITEVPDMAFVGILPIHRGSDIPGKDTELQILDHFPLCALFTEKPITGDEPPFEHFHAILPTVETVVNSCGFKLRYLKAVDMMAKIIRENNLRLMITHAVHSFPYEFSGSMFPFCNFFDKVIELGRESPVRLKTIVSQACHIVDLSRYFAGEPVDGTYQAATVELEDGPGRLSCLEWDEHVIPKERRVPRVTHASWRWESGAIGTLTHSVSLHDGEYGTELTLIADGWHLHLTNPYGVPKLRIRRPGAEEEVIRFEDDDPFYNEVEEFVRVVTGEKGPEAIRSTYADALKTCDMTWKIRFEAEKHYANRQPVGEH